MDGLEVKKMCYRNEKDSGSEKFSVRSSHGAVNVC